MGGWTLAVHANNVNKYFKAFVFVWVTLVFLPGCGLVYQSRRDELLKTAKVEDYGVKPPVNFVKQEEDYLRADLKDPDSAEFRNDNLPPVTDIIQSGFGSPQPILVWTHILEMNGKNGFGGYVGYQPYKFAWKDGKMVAVYSTDIAFWVYLKN